MCAVQNFNILLIIGDVIAKDLTVIGQADQSFPLHRPSLLVFEGRVSDSPH